MPTVRESSAKYLAELTRRGASAHTLRNYGADLEQFAAYFDLPNEAAQEVSALDLAMLREWLADLYDHEFATATIRRKMAAVRAMFQFLLEEGAIPSNVAGRL